MNKDQALEAIKVMQALVDGKVVEFRGNRNAAWKEVDPVSAAWNFFDNEYRIPPVPMEIEVWVHPNGRGNLLEPFNANDPEKLGYIKKIFREVL